MNTNNETPRMLENSQTNAEDGRVVWHPLKSIWYLSHLLIAIIGGTVFFSLSAFVLFIIFTATTICLGHSLGMHRRLIHNSYKCPSWMEYLFVHFGVLVGMAGPFGMIHQHDLRDWAQRKRNCHSYLRHGNSFLKDAWWQLNCDLELQNPPEFTPEERIKNDRVYNFMEKTWMLQQLPWAVVFFYIGGISWVIWGISARIAISITGHWLIGYFAHNGGQRDWHVNGAAVQGYNVRFVGLITMGESWHNNHHAFPGSAMLGIYHNQADPGWWVINRLMNIGLIWDVKLPKDLPERVELVAIAQKNKSLNIMKQAKYCPLIQRLKASI
jgi:stearoyl-CoA desaturase (delta-9 desaturase)